MTQNKTIPLSEKDIIQCGETCRNRKTGERTALKNIEVTSNE